MAQSGSARGIGRRCSVLVRGVRLRTGSRAIGAWCSTDGANDPTQKSNEQAELTQRLQTAAANERWLLTCNGTEARRALC